MKTNPHFTRRPLAVLLTALLTLAATAGLRAQSIIQEFFVPMPEAQLQTSLNAIDTAGTKVGNTIKVVIALVTGATNSIIKYDHWEDGYENDLNNPTQLTTQIWGDGNLANGVAPRLPHRHPPVRRGDCPHQHRHPAAQPDDLQL